MIKLSHFQFEVKHRRIKRDIWDFWQKLKQKEKLDDADKYWLQKFRSLLKESEYALIVTHKNTGIKRKWVLKNLKFDRKHYAKELLKEVISKRQSYKTLTYKSRNFEGANYKLLGGVFPTWDQIKEIAKHVQYNNPHFAKKPRSITKRYIGVELEFNHHPTNPYRTDHIAEKLLEKGLGKYVHVGTDGSCGFEVRVLLDETEFIEPLTKIMDTIKEMGFPCNEQCGTHVHLDMRKRDVKRVYSNFFYTQTFMRKLLAKSRKKNRFCMVNEYEDFDKQSNQGDRYRGINVQSYREHQTLEIRMHQGTLESSELIPWIKLLLQIANYDGKLEKKALTLKQVKEQYQLDDGLTLALQDRLGSLFGRVLNRGA